MEFIYTEDYSPIHDGRHCGKQTSMKIVGESMYVIFECFLSSTDKHTKNIQVKHIRKPSHMSLLENGTYTGDPPYNGQGHFSIIDGIQCHPKSYTDVLHKVFHIPDFFGGGNILTLSDKIISIWEEGLEVHTTSRLKGETIGHLGGTGGTRIRPIRFFLARNNIHSVEGTGRIMFADNFRYNIVMNEFDVPIGNSHKTTYTITFTNEEEYTKTLRFLIDNLFSAKKNTEDLLEMGGNAH